MKNKNFHLLLLSIVLILFIWSVINPKEYLTWILEVFPVIIGAIILIRIYPKFQFTNLVYLLMAIHAIILIIGGHYTYAEVPFFNWLRDIGVFTRNNYDKIGHFAQGFVPALISREILVRTSPVKSGKWLHFFCLTIVLSITSIYELIEWIMAVLLGSSGDSFLGTQGYIWDTQTDMALALLGGILSISFLRKIHDKELSKINKSEI